MFTPFAFIKNIVTASSVSDPDAQAFITAAGITNPTQQNAVNNLVIGLKADSLWTKMTAIYPFVGGTATSHKYNLKDPRDLDAAYRITFNGGWTHNSNGITGDGTTGYAYTYVTIRQTGGVLPAGINHHSSYIRSRSTAGFMKFTGVGGSNGTRFGWGAYNTGGTWFIGGQNFVNTNVSSANGFLMLSCEMFGGFGQSNLIFNGNAINYGSFTNNFDSNGAFVLGAFWDNGISSGQYNNTNYAFVSLGDTINSSIDWSNLNTRVQAFQVALGRNV